MRVSGPETRCHALWEAKIVAKKRVLFQPLTKGNWHRCVTLNWSGDPISDLERIAERYQSVAHDRVEVLKSQDRLYGGDVMKTKSQCLSSKRTSRGKARERSHDLVSADHRASVGLANP